MKRIFTWLLLLAMLVAPVCVRSETVVDEQEILNNLAVLFPQKGVTAYDVLLAWLTERLGKETQTAQTAAADVTLTYQAAAQAMVLGGSGTAIWTGVTAEQGMSVFAAACAHWSTLAECLQSGQKLHIRCEHPGMSNGGMFVSDAAQAQAYAQVLARSVPVQGVTPTNMYHQLCGTACPHCNGSGSHNAACGQCGGHGAYSCSRCGGDGQRQCGSCHGSGHHSNGHHSSRGKCSSCSGSGYRTCSGCSGRGRHNCGQCGGAGSVNTTCSWCNGTGCINQ